MPRFLALPRGATHVRSRVRGIDDTNIVEQLVSASGSSQREINATRYSMLLAAVGYGSITRAEADTLARRFTGSSMSELSLLGTAHAIPSGTTVGPNGPSTVIRTADTPVAQGTAYFPFGKKAGDDRDAVQRFLDWWRCDNAEFFGVENSAARMACYTRNAVIVGVGVLGLGFALWTVKAIGD